MVTIITIIKMNLLLLFTKIVFFLPSTSFLDLWISPTRSSFCFSSLMISLGSWTISSGCSATLDQNWARIARLASLVVHHCWRCSALSVRSSQLFVSQWPQLEHAKARTICSRSWTDSPGGCRIVGWDCSASANAKELLRSLENEIWGCHWRFSTSARKQGLYHP